MTRRKTPTTRLPFKREINKTHLPDSVVGEMAIPQADACPAPPERALIYQCSYARFYMILREVVRSNRSDFDIDEPAPNSLASVADVDFFKAALTQKAWPITAPSQNSNMLTVASSELTRTTDQLKRTLKAISKKGNDELLGKFPNQLSNALFQSQILVKSLGKATQCIDKISNLQ